MNATWQQMLVDGHRELFVRHFRGVAVSPGFPACSDGWRDLVTLLVERVSTAAHGHRIHFTEILERHGVLDVYWTAKAAVPQTVEFAVDQAIALARARSACTCAKCGAAGVLFSSGTRLVTLCPAHAAGTRVPVARGFENVHITRDVIGSKSAVARRYDRASDSFVEIDPRSLGIEED